jgi:hypothetical protein
MISGDVAAHVMDNEIHDLLDQAEIVREHRPAKLVTAVQVDLGTQSATTESAKPRPDTVRTCHRSGYRSPIGPTTETRTIGTYHDGQFYGCAVAGFRDGHVWTDDWAIHKRWYAVLHRVDHDGNHAGSEAWFAGTTEDGEAATIQRAQTRLRDWLDHLAGRAYGDIAIRLFEITIDGVTFGLVDESDEDGEHVELNPNELGFYPPWDGEYDT